MLRHSDARSCDGTENLREDEQWKSKERSENAWLAKAKKSGASQRVAREWPRIEWLDYGELRGIGQWRNSGKGRFKWHDITDSQK